MSYFKGMKIKLIEIMDISSSQTLRIVSITTY